MTAARRTWKTQTQLAHEWDLIASTRHEQIATGVDITFHSILAPTITKLVGSRPGARVVDVGCGTGELTHAVAGAARETIGVDMSRASVRIARRSGTSSAQFVWSTIEDFSKRKPALFDAAIANMMLMDAVGLEDTLAAVSRLVVPGGELVATITHPCFWPKYWHYELEPWFNYMEEIFIEAPFVISRQATRFRTTHIHRPLERYYRALSAVGFVVTEIVEPMPPAEVENLYPERWRFPRYLAFKAAKLT